MSGYGMGGATFHGGPRDGEVRDLRLGPDGNPPTVVTFLGPVRPRDAADPESPVEVTQHHYHRNVSPHADGPLWEYRYDNPQPAKEG